MADTKEAFEKAKTALKSPTPERVCSEQEMRFAQAFVNLNGDGPAALKAAGYNMKNRESAAAMVRKLKQRPHVAQAIALASNGAKLVRKHREALAPENAPDVATGDEVLRFLTDVMRGVVEGDAAKVRVQLRAAEHLARHHGIIVDRNETAPVVVQTGNEDGGVRVILKLVDNKRGPELLEAGAIETTAEVG